MSLSTVATKDFYVRFYKPEATDRQQVRFTRQSTVALGMMATILAIIMSFTAKTLNETLMESNTIWGSIITVVPPVFFVGVMSRRANANHVLRRDRVWADADRVHAGLVHLQQDGRQADQFHDRLDARLRRRDPVRPPRPLLRRQAAHRPRHESVRPVYTVVTANGKPAVLLNINRQLNGNTVQVADEVHREIAAIQKTLPPDVHLEPFYDQSEIVNDSIRSGAGRDFDRLGVGVHHHGPFPTGLGNVSSRRFGDSCNSGDHLHRLARTGRGFNLMTLEGSPPP